MHYYHAQNDFSKIYYIFLDTRSDIPLHSNACVEKILANQFIRPL